MAAIEFPLSSLPGQQPLESQGRLINAYTETDGGQNVQKHVPGLDIFSDVGVSFPRGFIASDQFLFGAFEGVVKRISSSGVPTSLTGALVGTDLVTWAKNNAVTPDIVVVTDLGAFSVTTTTVVPFADVNLPGSPTCCAGMDGYIFFGFGDGRVFATGLNVVTVNALSFTTAEANTDGVSRLIVSGRQLYIFGSATIEIFQNVGSSPFPLARSAVIPVGLRSKFAVAGGNESDGWDSSPLFVAADGTVRQFNGYDPAIVSTRAVERDIASVNKDDLEAYVYTFYGNSVWGIKAPTFCWEFNTSTQRWHERQSYNSATWRGTRSILAFDKWRFGDELSTKVLSLNADGRTESGDPLVCQIESKLGSSFPGQRVISQADFMFAPGVGIAAGQVPIQTNPQVQISWSDDGGATWSVPLWREIGPQGDYRKPVRVNRTGLTSQIGRRWRLVVSDPVDMIFMGGTMEVEERV